MLSRKVRAFPQEPRAAEKGSISASIPRTQRQSSCSSLTVLISLRQMRWHDQQLLADFLREAHIKIHGIKLDQPDWSDESHSLALPARGPAGWMFHFMINAYWEALAFELPPTAEGAGWRRWIDTSLASPHDICEAAEAPPIADPTYLVQPRSTACLFAEPRD
jgi:pullulanase/glycogen debranching enzyme